MQKWRYDEEEVVRLLKPTLSFVKTKDDYLRYHFDDNTAFSLLFRLHLGGRSAHHITNLAAFGHPVQLRLLGLSRGTLESTLAQRIQAYLLPKDHPERVLLPRVLQFVQYLVDHHDLLTNIPDALKIETWNGWTGLILRYEPDEIWSTDKSYRALFNAATAVLEREQRNYPIQAANALSPSSKPVVGLATRLTENLENAGYQVLNIGPTNAEARWLADHRIAPCASLPINFSLGSVQEKEREQEPRQARLLPTSNELDETIGRLTRFSPTGRLPQKPSSSGLASRLSENWQAYSGKK
jgi:hypothetical protein